MARFAALLEKPIIGESLGAVVGLSGFEPLTSRLSGGRSNQLSYRPDFRGGRARQLPHSCADAGNQVGWPSSPCELLCLPSGFRRKSNSSVRKEVIQPQVPLRLPCYDFTPVMNPTVVSAPLAVRLPTSGETHSHGVTGGVYKTRERIHRDMLIRDY